MRLDRGLTALKVAEQLSITPQHLSRIENGAQAPSRLLLEDMIGFYHLATEDADALRASFGYPTQLSRDPQRMSMPGGAKFLSTGAASPPVLKLDPIKTPVYFSNAIAISSDELGLVIDAGQKVASSNEIQVLGRIGLNLEHAALLHEHLGAHIKKLRREQSAKS
jgi:transcriptional regulator with XRE-family HTH domain